MMKRRSRFAVVVQGLAYALLFSVGHAFAYEPVPHFRVDPSSGRVDIWGHQWPADATITVTIGSDPMNPDFQEFSTADSYGDWWLHHEAYAVKAGDLVTVSDGVTTIENYVVADLSITEINLDNDTISGTAKQGSWVSVHIHHDEAPLGRHVQTDVNGNWLADFSVADGEDDWNRVFDIKPGHEGAACQCDDQGEPFGSTHIHWRVDRPHFKVDPVDNHIWGHQWPVGETVTVTRIGAPDEPIGAAEVNEWGDWNLWDAPYDIQAGNLVRVECGEIVREHLVRAAQVVSVNRDTDTVSGTAAMGAWVNVSIYGTHISRYVEADPDGFWQADFSVAGGEEWEVEYDIQANTRGCACQYDDEGNSTHISWRPDRPILRVQPASHNFGHVDLGVSVTQAFEVVNIGQSNLEIGTVNLLDGHDLAQFTIVQDTVSDQTLVPDASGHVTIVFIPTNIWGKAVALQIPSNDEEVPVYTVRIYGTGHSETEAETLFVEGLNLLAGFMSESAENENLIEANERFDAALTANPEHSGAAIFRLLTRLFALPFDEDVARMLTDFGMPEEGRNLRDWTAEFPSNRVDNPPGFDAVVHLVANKMDEIIEEGLTNLGNIPVEWTGSVIFSPEHLPIDNEVQVDAGDVQMFQCVLSFLRGALGMLRAHDWYFDFKHLDHLDTHRRTITVDGDPFDWDGIRPLHIDAQGNHYGPDSTDIHRVFTAMDDTHAYIMIETYGKPIHEDAPISVILNFKPGRTMWLPDPIDRHNPEHDNLGIRFAADALLDAWDTNEVTIAGIEVARGAVFEASIPLSELDDPEYVTITYVNIWPEGTEGVPGNPISIKPRLSAYLEDYPRFGAITNAAGFAQAVDRLVEAIDFYMAGSSLIRSETDWQGDDLFVFDPESLDAEAQARQVLRQLRDSLTGDADVEPFSFEISRFLDLKHLFENPVNLRTLRFGAGHQEILTEMVMWQIDHALNSLETVDSNYQQTLTAGNAPVIDDVYLDYGDIVMVKSWLNAWKAFIHVVRAYDMNLDLVELAESPAPRISNVLEAYDDLLTVADPVDLAVASNLLAAAFTGYLQGSDDLRARGDVPGETMFSIVDDKLLLGAGPLTDAESRFKTLLEDLNASLTIPRLIRYRHHERGGDVFYEHMHLGKFFVAPYVTRAHLPRYDDENRIVEETFMDPTFTGIFPDMSQWCLAMRFAVDLADSHGIGIPDLWQKHYFGATGIDPEAHADGSGFSNLQQYLAGTDPRDRESSLRFLASPVPAQPDDPRMIIRWRSEPYRYYKITSTSDLLGGQWDVEAIVLATPYENVFIDSDPEANRKYYRVQVLR